jgi:hypothetical protein
MCSPNNTSAAAVFRILFMLGAFALGAHAQVTGATGAGPHTTTGTASGPLIGNDLPGQMPPHIRGGIGHH